MDKEKKAKSMETKRSNRANKSAEVKATATEQPKKSRRRKLSEIEKEYGFVGKKGLTLEIIKNYMINHKYMFEVKEFAKALQSLSAEERSRTNTIKDMFIDYLAPELKVVKRKVTIDDFNEFIDQVADDYKAEQHNSEN